MRDPSWLRCRSRYSRTPVRNNMKPSVTVTRKMSVESAQNAKVCAALVGPNSPKLKETCHTTRVSRVASNTRPEPKTYRLRIGIYHYRAQVSGGSGQALYPGGFT